MVKHFPKDFPGACTISTGGQHLCALQQASGLVVCCWDEFLMFTVSNKASYVCSVAFYALFKTDQNRTCPFQQRLISGFYSKNKSQFLQPENLFSYPCYPLLSDFLRRFQGWGAGDFGQLGDNRATSSDCPVHVRGGGYSRVFLWFNQWLVEIRHH